MRGCLFTLALGFVVVALIVLIGLPAIAAGVLTAGVRAAGIQSNDITINVTSDPPWDLTGLRADRVRVRATAATFRGLQVGALDVTLQDVALLDRTAAGVNGQLTGVTVPNIGGHPLVLAAIILSGGGGSAVTATTTIAAIDAQTLVASEIASATGLNLPATAVHLAAPNKVAVKAAGLTGTATLSVDATGNLVATVPGVAPVIVLRAGEDLPIRLTAVQVNSSGGLALAGTLAVSLLGG
jgi:hypothetical protein